MPIQMLFEVVLILATAAALFVVRRTWKDPRNWRLDPSRPVVFNHWKELWLAILVALTLAGIAVFWIM
jgi:hypothetical protein